VPRSHLLRLARVICLYDPELLSSLSTTTTATLPSSVGADATLLRKLQFERCEQVVYHLVMILSHLLVLMSEEEVFWCAVSLLRGRFAVRKLITASLRVNSVRPVENNLPVPDDSIFSFCINRLLQNRLPKLFAHVQFHCPSLFSTTLLSWSPSLLAGILSPDALFRFWDVLFFQGPKLLFRWLLLLFTQAADDLLSIFPMLPSDTGLIIKASMETCLKDHAENLSTRPSELMTNVCAVSLSTAEMAELENEFYRQSSPSLHSKENRASLVDNQQHRWFIQP
jgi:hypothetical protein